MDTLKQAKIELRANFDKGVECPCCGQLVKRYARLFDSGLARFVISLYVLSNGKPNQAFDKDTIRNHAGITKLKATNYGLIRHWKIAKTPKTKDSAKRTSGLWMLTDLGVSFVNNLTTIPKYCYTFDNRTDGFSEKHINIKTALGKHFNYSELMEIVADTNMNFKHFKQ